jgi:hypothetical protein
LFYNEEIFSRIYDNMEFSIAINGIKEVRKVGGLGWRSTLGAGWAMAHGWQMNWGLLIARRGSRI